MKRIVKIKEGKVKFINKVSAFFCVVVLFFAIESMVAGGILLSANASSLGRVKYNFNSD